MKMTLTRTSDTYIVHELVTTKDILTPCFPADNVVENVREQDFMHGSEMAGLDIGCTPDGFWKGVLKSRGAFGEVIVDAGPISHRGQSNDVTYLILQTIQCFHRSMYRLYLPRGLWASTQACHPRRHTRSICDNSTLRFSTPLAPDT